MNDTDLNISNTYSIYLPNEYINYKYLYNITNDYIELTDTKTFTANNTYDVIRIYNNYEGLIVEREIITPNYYTTTSHNVVNVTNNFFARKDIEPILIGSIFIIVISLYVLNKVTEFFKKGGVFGGLF